MKIHTVCMKCQINDLAFIQEITEEGINITLMDDDFIVLQINDDNVYPYTCKNGHKNALILQTEKYELLFESATHAISDGYYKEAISSIASSVERLYEYCVKIISFKNNIGLEDIDKSWKLVSSQSERQLGAFVFLYQLEFDSLAPTFRDDQVKFRNKVIHKGHFPTLEEVLLFGESALKIVFEVLGVLQKNCRETIENWQNIRISEMGNKAKNIADLPTTLSQPTIISIALSKDIILTGTVLKDYVVELSGRKRK